MNPMKSVARALMALAALLGPVSVNAQIAPGRSGQSSMSYFGGQEAWDTLAEFGDCFASRQRTEALRLVSTKPDSVDEVDAYTRIFRHQNQSCLSLASEMRVPYQIVRGAITEGLFRRGVAVPQALAVANAPKVTEVRNFMDAALCFAATHRDEVRALLATTKLGTKKEDERITALRPAIGTCIPANARAISISSSMIRVRLAEAMWRLGETPTGQGAP
jgi:hypothetical protein